MDILEADCHDRVRLPGAVPLGRRRHVRWRSVRERYVRVEQRPDELGRVPVVNVLLELRQVDLVGPRGGARRARVRVTRQNSVLP